MNSSDWQLAETIARELVNRETDVNELQKATTYARIQSARPEEKVGEKFFALLDTMARDGRFLMRSGRTMDYYRTLQSTCKQHLSGYRTATGAEGKKLVEILAWTARLMRYYNTEAGDAELVARENERVASQPPVERKPETVAPPPPTKPSKKQSKPKKPPVLVEATTESVTLLASAIGSKARVSTERGEEIPCVNFPPFPMANAGEICDAEVTRENGRAVRAVFQRWK